MTLKTLIKHVKPMGKKNNGKCVTYAKVLVMSSE